MTAVAPAFAPANLADGLRRIRETGYVVLDEGSGALGFAVGGTIGGEMERGYPIVGTLPPLYPEYQRSLTESHLAFLHMAEASLGMLFGADGGRAGAVADAGARPVRVPLHDALCDVALVDGEGTPLLEMPDVALVLCLDEG